MATAREQAKYRKRLHLNAHQPLTVPAGLAVAHIQTLRAQGMGLRPMTAQSGVDKRTLQRISNEQQHRIAVHTHRAILALTLHVQDGVRTSPIPTHRRLRALVAQGFSLNELDRLRGVTPRVTHDILSKKSVTYETEKEIEALYNRLDGAVPPADTPGQRSAATRARNYARAHGWAPPAAWNNIEDHHEKPKGMRAA